MPQPGHYQMVLVTVLVAFAAPALGLFRFPGISDPVAYNAEGLAKWLADDSQPRIILKGARRCH